MSVINEQTAYLGLALPHPSNHLQDDVLRLRLALHSLDAVLEQMQQYAAQKTDDAPLQLQLQELQQGIEDLSDAKVSTVNGQRGVNVTLYREHLRLGPANGASSSALTYDDSGRVTHIVQIIDGQQCLQAMDYHANGSVKTITTTFKGRTRTEAFSYDNGRISGSTATEI